MKPVAAGLLLMGALTLADGAGAIHITDKLAVGLHEARGDDRPKRVLISGTPLELLERQGDLCRVQLGDGDSGWLECRYLTDEKPARTMLVESQARAGQLWDQVEGLKRQLEQKQQRLDELELRLQAAAQIVEQQGGPGAVPEVGETEKTPLAGEIEPPGGAAQTGPELRLLLALLLGAAGGLLVGALLLYWRCRRRFGGLRI